MNTKNVAQAINEFSAEKPTLRWLQELRDSLTKESLEMLRSLLDETAD